MSKSKSSRFEYSWISDNRGVLMGIATILVILFHSFSLTFGFLQLKPLISVFTFIRKHGNAGVDIFLLLSGLGLFYALEKNSSISNFYKRRFVRVFPAVFIVAIIFYAVSASKINLLQYLSKIFLIDFYITGKRYFWYFSLLLLLYLVYPFIHRFIKNKPKRILILIVAAIALNILLMLVAPKYYSKIEIAISRIPIFLVGVGMGYMSKNKKSISLLPAVLISLILLTGSVLCYVFDINETNTLIARSLCGVIAISLVILLSALFHRFNMKTYKRFHIWIGTYSMEIYLLFEKMTSLFKDKIGNDQYNICFYLAILTITIIGSVLLKLIVDTLINVYRNSKPKLNNKKKIKEE